MRNAGPKIASLMFHEVADDPTTSGFQRAAALPYTLTRRAFARLLDAIAAGPLAPRLVTQTNLTQPGRHLFLTFDDGGRSAVYVAEELARREWLAHFFIVTDRIGQSTFLDGEDIRHLRRCGHVIGSHSHTHPDIFRAQAPERMLEEWRVSSDILSSLLGEPCVTGSVPGGDISPTVLHVAAEAGLQFLFTSEPRVRAQRVATCCVLGRFCMKAHASPATVRDLVRMRGWRRALFERRLKELARRGLGSLYGAYVRRITRAWSPPRARPAGGAGGNAD